MPLAVVILCVNQIAACPPCMLWLDGDKLVYIGTGTSYPMNLAL